MAKKICLFYHPLCPFAQRILHVVNFKGLDVALAQMDMSLKNEWYLKLNPDNFTPALQVTTETRNYFLKDSLIISQYLESLKGPFLYPQISPGVVNSLEKSLIDMRIQSHIEPLRKIIGYLYHEPNPTPAQLSQFKSAVEKVNLLVTNGQYFSSLLFGKNHISFIDLMALPLIERLIAFKDMNLPYYENCQISSILQWYQNMASHDFIKQSQHPLHRYSNLRSSILNKTYQGLVLPTTKYDSTSN